MFNMLIKKKILLKIKEGGGEINIYGKKKPNRDRVKKGVQVKTLYSYKK